MNAPPDPPAVLIVEDEPVVLGSLKGTLEREQIHVVACASPLKALTLLAERDFAVIISDQRMPEMLGLDFLIESRKHSPHSSRILLTAVLNLPTAVDAINRGEIYRFVAKPWLREELVATVRNAIQRHQLTARNQALLGETKRLEEQLARSNQSVEAQRRELERQRQLLESAQRDLAVRDRRSLELGPRILTAFDPILGSRTRALFEFADKMAESEHFLPAERHALRVAAGWCDLGLVGMPRSLLRTFHGERKHLLSDAERALLRNHPIDSQTLAALVDLGPGVGETIRAHHESFDGSGYPDGLAAAGIPWTARCLAVAVGFVESGQAKELATESILAQAGKIYDPEAVRLFLKVTHLVNLPRSVNEVLLDELQPGMTLATGLYSPTGLLLVREGQTLGPGTIATIRRHNAVTPISQCLLVYS